MTTRTSTSNIGEQKLQDSLECWKKFDLSCKLQHVSSILREQKEQREASKQARSNLADTTKRFKKYVKTMDQSMSSPNTPPNPSWDPLSKECRILVKSYQEEIDNLTKRCKTAETSYQSLASQLSSEGLIDPALLLEQALKELSFKTMENQQLLQTMEKVNGEMTQMQQQHAAAAQQQQEASKPTSSLTKADREELVQLRREVAEYEVEFRSLKNQDITIRKLEAKIQSMEESQQALLEQEVGKLREQVQQTEGLKAAEALEREAAALRKCEMLAVQLQAERAAQQATQHQMEDQTASLSTVEAAWEAQRSILVQDSERLRENLHSVARERDELALQLAASKGAANKAKSFLSSAPSSGGLVDVLAERQAYEAEVSELSHMANALREELRAKEDAIIEERRSLQGMLEQKRNHNQELLNTVAMLEQQLAIAPSQSLVDSMKRELRILKRLEYNALDLEEEQDHLDPELQVPAADVDDDLEKVLVAKLGRVESELVRERNAKVELSKSQQKYKEQLQKLEQEQQQSRKLIASLEADLERAIVTVSPVKNKSVKSVPSVAVAPENPDLLGSILDPASGKRTSTTKPPPPQTKPTKESAAEDDHSVATIVMAQRDRLRARCDAMEAERDSFKRELQAQVAALESLKVDNTKLYEKVRYLQNYNAKPRSSKPTTGNSRDLDLEALEQRYEASVDPFRQFGRAERQRKLQEMSPMERIVFMVAKTVLGSKEMRTALFFYMCGLHLLVFLATTHWSHSDTCGGHAAAHHEYLSHLPPDQHQQMANYAVAAAAAAASANDASG